MKSWAEEIQAGMELTWGSLVQRIGKDLQRASPGPDNAPFLIGNAAEPLPMRDSRPLAYWRLDRLRAPTALPSSAVDMYRSRKWPNARRVIARDDAAAGRFQTAAHALKSVAHETNDPRNWLQGARAQVAANQLDDALLSLQALTRAEAWPAETTRASEAVRTLAEARPRALLVGIGQYRDRKIPAAEGVDADLALMPPSPD